MRTTANTSKKASHRPPLRKALGQHHLRSGSLVRPLMEYLKLGDRDRAIVEIGPGGGILTIELLRAGARVLALELDPRWAFALAQRLRSEFSRSEPNPTNFDQAGLRHTAAGTWALCVGDGLDLEWSCLKPHHQVVGNLPYGVATAILRRALASAVCGVRLGFLVQLEVAQRICAGPGDPQYGALSVQVRARTGGGQSSVQGGSEGGAKGEARILGRVRPGAFVPPPKVESAFVGLQLVEPAVPAKHWQEFCQLVFAGFSQRRKTLRNSLSSRYAKAEVAVALQRSEIGPLQRAEELDVDAWVRIFASLVPNVGDNEIQEPHSLS